MMDYREGFLVECIFSRASSEEKQLTEGDAEWGFWESEQSLKTLDEEMAKRAGIKKTKKTSTVDPTFFP